jgi:hypothetical protein
VNKQDKEIIFNLVQKISSLERQSSDFFYYTAKKEAKQNLFAGVALGIILSTLWFIVVWLI